MRTALGCFIQASISFCYCHCYRILTLKAVLLIMEPLTILGAVSSIVNLVEFSARILSTGVEIYKSSSGALSENVTLEQVTKDLLALSHSLDRSMETETWEFTDPENDRAIKLLCKSSNRVAGELLIWLEHLKYHGKQKPWNIARQSLRAVMGKSKTEHLVQTMNEIKQQLDLRLSTSLRYIVCLVEFSQSKY